jgi:hypothetical protein
MTRADQIFEAFKKFHAANPTVWELFSSFTFQSINRGRTRYSCDAVFERIRWHVDIDTQGQAVKLNNNFRAYYARMFEAKNPEHAGFFRNRKRTSTDSTAYAVDIQVWNSGPPIGENQLLEQLRQL